MDIRQKLIEAIGREIIGPAPHPAYSAEDGEELILSRIHGTPKSRYGVAMLYPQLTINEGEVDDKTASAVEPLFAEENEELKGSRITDITGSEDDEEPVSLANQFLPSAMGFTLRFKRTPAQNTIILKTSAAAYEREKGFRPVLKVAPENAGQMPVTKANGEVIESEFWKRKSFAIDPVTIDLGTIKKEKIVKDIPLIQADKGDWLKLKIYNRTTPADDSEGFLTLTFVLVNCMKSVTDGSRNDKYILYQTKLRLETENEALIAPYSERVAATNTAEEDQLKLLYRKKRVYAIGHGTAVNWKLRNLGVESVETSAIPVYEMPQVAPAGDVVQSMYDLSTEGNWGQAAGILNDLLSAYEQWINGIEKEKEGLESQYQKAAAASIAKCRECYDRIKRGIETLLAAEENSDLVRCFRWMNSAMPWQ
ncbi:hypothetical protein [Mucilaginibacter flavidus]|uniref:hypothetical protein n=1 Tax=Mucilaginibacter flavidus TaxID=2949309 RepID=UPI002093414B|nr:hypothetical protein [Mucilaginibacter flavidus]MCO5950688.1 hypothetical protein [Mucilaginibacter flavidus]